jgi:two-component system, cell cycle response regulator DivK
MARILLVEDNELNRDMLSRRLRRQGFAVEIAANGRQGLDAARSGTFALILMDLSLPGLDGWTVARLLKEDPSTRTIPIIALTAHAMSGDRERAIEAGCDDYDTKPVDFARLLAKIAALLSRKDVASAIPSSSPLPLGEGPGVRGIASPTARDEGSLVHHSTGHDPHPGPLPGGEGGRQFVRSIFPAPPDQAGPVPSESSIGNLTAVPSRLDR